MIADENGVLDKQATFDLIKGLTREELMWLAHNAEQIAKRKTQMQFRVGSFVSFVNGGKKYVGKVKKINKKSINVSCGQYDEWRVGPSHLEVATKAEYDQYIEDKTEAKLVAHDFLTGEKI